MKRRIRDEEVFLPIGFARQHTPKRMSPFLSKHTAWKIRISKLSWRRPTGMVIKVLRSKEQAKLCRPQDGEINQTEDLLVAWDSTHLYGVCKLLTGDSGIHVELE